ncbi:hypothetical protein HI914_05744 [Erysiphe necator]|nr:hypothetical protein HI914_05744 [Erysiphe necator]
MIGSTRPGEELTYMQHNKNYYQPQALISFFNDMRLLPDLILLHNWSKFVQELCAASPEAMVKLLGQPIFFSPGISRNKRLPPTLTLTKMYPTLCFPQNFR